LDVSSEREDLEEQEKCKKKKVKSLHKSEVKSLNQRGTKHQRENAKNLFKHLKSKSFLVVFFKN
jgi:hypothetical protein